MYLSEKEAALLSGIMELEFSEKDRIKLARSFQNIVDFKGPDSSLADEATMNTLLTFVPKQNLFSEIKSIRPDLHAKISFIQNLSRN